MIDIFKGSLIQRGYVSQTFNEMYGLLVFMGSMHVNYYVVRKLYILLKVWLANPLCI